MTSVNNLQHFELTQAKFSLDPNRQLLLTSSAQIHLRNKLWNLLIFLVKNADQLVTRDELIESVWLGNYLTGEKGLTHGICHLRRIIKKAGLDLKIVTIPKKGYILTDQTASYQLLVPFNRKQKRFVEQTDSISSKLSLNQR